MSKKELVSIRKIEKDIKKLKERLQKEFYEPEHDVTITQFDYSGGKRLLDIGLSLANEEVVDKIKTDIVGVAINILNQQENKVVNCPMIYHS